jgi:hypothetical protein
MKYLFLITLTFSFLLNSNEIEFKEGDEFLVKKFSSIALFSYRTDATKVNIAKDLSYSLNDFMNYATVDQRDIYKIRKGDSFVLIDSYRGGDIFEVTLNSKRTSREKYFILSEDLRKSSLALITEES